MEICNSSMCTGCGVCEIKCPKDAISMVVDEKGFFVPDIDDDLCIGCNLCISSCHINSYIKHSSEIELSYAACIKDNSLRKKASSGAIVTVLAKKIFEENGAVVGAIFDENNHLYEDIAFSWDEYEKKSFSRSKYVQSETRDCFVKIKDYLSSGKPMMFVGTPCLNAALHTYLGRSYPNLITVDFVCHGVPSPGVFESYCKYLEGKYKSKIKKIDFRVKKPSWSLSSTEYRFENGKIYRGNMMDDLYNACFATNNNNIRSSCNGCKYACKERTTDITVCDYWGKREVELTKKDAEYGVSAVMIHSAKGKSYFEKIQNDIIFKQVSYESIENGNERLYNNMLPIQDGEGFWKDYISGKTWVELKPYCRSYLDSVSKKQRFMMLYGNSLPIKVLRKVKQLVIK